MPGFGVDQSMKGFPVYDHTHTNPGSHSHIYKRIVMTILLIPILFTKCGCINVRIKGDRNFQSLSD